MQRRDKTAMHWKLLRRTTPLPAGQEVVVAPTPQEQVDKGETVWGPGMLWVPTALQIYRKEVTSEIPEADRSGEPAGREELGDEWGNLGADWRWAHDGNKQNGWFRLCKEGHLTSKWGEGTWQLVRPVDEEDPLVLITFGGVEHALRLFEGEAGGGMKFIRFDVVSMRRIKDGQDSLTDDQAGLLMASDPAAEVVSTAQGWPSAGA